MERHQWKNEQAHLGPAQGEKGLNEEEALAKARRAKAEDIRIRHQRQ